jgi:hypothetical protein
VVAAARYAPPLGLELDGLALVVGGDVLHVERLVLADLRAGISRGGLRPRCMRLPRRCGAGAEEAEQVQQSPGRRQRAGRTLLGAVWYWARA